MTKQSMPEVEIPIKAMDLLVEAMHPADRFRDLDDERPHLILKLMMAPIKIVGMEPS